MTRVSCRTMASHISSDCLPFAVSCAATILSGYSLHLHRPSQPSSAAVGLVPCRVYLPTASKIGPWGLACV